jgi:hypothetical protein
MNTTKREGNPNVSSKFLDQVEEPEEEKRKGIDFKQQRMAWQESRRRIEYK